MRNGNLAVEYRPAWMSRPHVLEESEREMRGKCYKILTPTIAILTAAGKRAVITIPQGAVITVLRVPVEDGHLVEAKWEDKAVQMFVTDLRERAIAVTQQ
jgi:hypothetical protein